MSVTLDDRKVFYGVLENMSQGYQDDLKTKVAFEDGSKFNELFNGLCSVGMITCGVDGLLKERYRVTELGKKQIKSYLLVYNS